MPFPMKIQPIDSDTESMRNEPGKPPVLKSRLKRLFDRQFPSVLKISTVDKPNAGESKDGVAAGAEFEPSSVCLDKMVQNFIEDSSEKPSSTAVKCGRNRCNCFNGNSNSSDDEFDVLKTFGDSISTVSFGVSSEMLKSLILCVSVAERNLLADTAKIVEKNKICKRKDDLRRIVTEGLSLLSYDASVCKSRWEKSPSYPAGEYEYIDVIVEGEKLLIDIDFRSEFEIARPTGTYKSVLQSLPYIFVGKPDRLKQIVSVVSEAAKQSLRKKGMPVPPWRKAEYMRAKWLSPSTRTTPQGDAVVCSVDAESETPPPPKSDDGSGGELDLIFGNQSPPQDVIPGKSLPESHGGDEKLEVAVVVSPWQPPAVKPKSCEKGAKIVTGLASLLREKP